MSYCRLPDTTESAVCAHSAITPPFGRVRLLLRQGGLRWST